ncbi:MAG: hypothetical protein ABMA64_37315 [Myxococcota bacterium]
MTGWIWLASCAETRDPTGAERHLALTADDLLPVAIKRVDLDKRDERWQVRRTGEGWSLEYDYQHESLSVTFRATRAPSASAAEAGWNSSAMSASFVDAMGGVELEPIAAPSWGDATECSSVAVTDLDVGFVCRGLSGPRMFSVTVYGVSPHGDGAPSRLLGPTLHALDAWEP